MFRTLRGTAGLFLRRDFYRSKSKLLARFEFLHQGTFRHRSIDHYRRAFQRWTVVLNSKSSSRGINHCNAVTDDFLAAIVALDTWKPWKAVNASACIQPHIEAPFALLNSRSWPYELQNIREHAVVLIHRYAPCWFRVQRLYHAYVWGYRVMSLPCVSHESVTCPRGHSPYRRNLEPRKEPESCVQLMLFIWWHVCATA